MLRVLAFVEARHCFHFPPLYLSTMANVLADDLSRDNLASLLSKVPDADASPSSVSMLDLPHDPEASEAISTFVVKGTRHRCIPVHSSA